MVYAKKSVESRTIAYERQRAAKWKRVRFRDNRLPETRSHILGGTGGCWCGEPYGHDWPGRDRDLPHPSPREIAGEPPKVRARMEQMALQDAGVCPNCKGYPSKQDGCPTCLDTGEFPPPTSARAAELRAQFYGNTHRFADGQVTTRATTKIKYARIIKSGKVHRIAGVLLDWNHRGGTRDKPHLRFLAACGPQRDEIFPVENPDENDVCAASGCRRYQEGA